MVIGKRFFAISLATATSLGYMAGFTADNIIAQAGHERKIGIPIKKFFPTSNPSITDLWNKVDAVACSDADTTLEMDAGTCSNFMNPCSTDTCVTLCCVDGCIDDDGNPNTPCIEQQVTTADIIYQFPGAWTPTVQ